MSLSDTLYLLFFVFMIFGIIFWCTLFWIKSIQISRYQKCTEDSFAKIMDVKKVRSRSHGNGFGRCRESICYDVISSYKIKNGKIVSLSHTYANNPEFLKKKGEILYIKYNPEKPEEYMFPSEKHYLNQTYRTMNVIALSFITAGIIGMILFSFISYYF